MSSSTFGGATNFVFWDAGDCKIPEGSTYAGMVKIFVYRTLAQVWTEDPPNLEKEIKVTIIPNEDQHWKHMKMMTDILMAWVDEEYIPANILFISGDMDMEISHLLYRLKMRGSNILLGQLEDKPRMFLPDTHTLWRWESLSIGGEPIAESFRPIRHPQPAEPIEQTGRRKRLRLGWQ
ncbi:unnamed protein product [Arabis nemorensis]|uniref:NYN domain-containing protein n=1 Tax=Arabis nemorensis TaxID=586526 RepID=A0A565BBU0_9BRAS|nr:unnamed protein product [Arabis nemorensis]